MVCWQVSGLENHSDLVLMLCSDCLVQDFETVGSTLRNGVHSWLDETIETKAGIEHSRTMFLDPLVCLYAGI